MSFTSPAEIGTKWFQESRGEGARSSFSGDLGLWNLESCLQDLLIAGTDTTSTGLTWAMLYMVIRPDVQRRVQAEIDAVVGKKSSFLGSRIAWSLNDHVKDLTGSPL